MSLDYLKFLTVTVVVIFGDIELVIEDISVFLPCSVADCHGISYCSPLQFSVGGLGCFYSRKSFGKENVSIRISYGVAGFYCLYMMQEIKTLFTYLARVLLWFLFCFESFRECFSFFNTDFFCCFIVFSTQS